MLSDGNTGAGHAPNKLIAARGGTISHVCRDSSSVAIRVGDLLYAHILNNSKLWVGYTFGENEEIGQLRSGSFNSQANPGCGWASQGSSSFHVHWGFPNDGSFSVEGWSLNLGDGIWRRGGETRDRNSWIQAGGGSPPPSSCSAPTQNNPGDGHTSTSRTVTFSWSGPGGCTFNGYTFRVKNASTMDSGGSTLIDTGEAGTQRTETINGWDNTDLYWGVRAANAPNGASWAVRRFRISPSAPPSSCSAPSLNSPTDGQTLTSRTVTFSWSSLGGCTFNGYTFRVKNVSSMDSGGTTLIDTGEAGTQRTEGFGSNWDGTELYWGVRAANAPNGANWAVRRFRIQPNSPPVQGSADPRQEGPVFVSGSLQTGGRAYITISVRNYGGAATQAIHPYVEGTNSAGAFWRADGSQPGSAIIQPGQTVSFQVQQDLGSSGTWTAYGIFLWDNSAGTYWQPLPANGQNQQFSFFVQKGGPTATPTPGAAYAPEYEGSIVISEGSTENWLLQNGQRRLIPDGETFGSIYQNNGQKYWLFPASEIARIPRGPDVPSVRTPTATSTRTPSGGCPSTAPAGSAAAIWNCRVREVSGDQAVITVDYRYTPVGTGPHYLNAFVSDSTDTWAWFGTIPTELTATSGTATVGVVYIHHTAPPTYRSRSIEVSIVPPSGVAVVRQTLPYERLWTLGAYVPYTPTPTPGPASTPGGARGETYRDDFTSNRGWCTGNCGGAETTISGGLYRASLSGTGAAAWFESPVRPRSSDVTVSADVDAQSGDAGIIFSMTSGTEWSFYLLMMSPGGGGGISFWKNSFRESWVHLGGISTPLRSASRSAQGLNALQVERSGTALIGSLNGSPVLTVTDDSLNGTGVGFYMQQSGNLSATAVATFGNFVVREAGVPAVTPPAVVTPPIPTSTPTCGAYPLPGVSCRTSRNFMPYAPRYDRPSAHSPPSGYPSPQGSRSNFSLARMVQRLLGD